MKFELNRWECGMVAMSLVFTLWMVYCAGKIAGQREMREVYAPLTTGGD
jgi:hypothetical protein